MRVAVLALLALLCSSTAASAETCVEAVDRFAAAHDLSATPPQAVPEHGGSGPTADRPATLESRGVTGALGESGGVIRPPDTDTGMAVRPPAEKQSRMPTAPDVQGEQSPGAGQSGADAVRRERVESMLTAARAAAERGDSEQCYQRLREAQDIWRAGPAGSPG